MGKIIMCGSFKGGVGKSVTTYNLAYSLAEIGKKVLCVDYDSQVNLTTHFGIEDVETLPVSIGHMMMSQIEEEEMTETFQGQIRIFESRIPNTVKVGESVYYSEPLNEYAPGNGVCEAYRMLAKEVTCA